MVGPAAGFVAALQFAGALAACPPAAPQLPPVATPAAVAAAVACVPPSEFMDALLAAPEAFRGGFYLVAAYPLSGFLHNIAFK